VLRFASAVSSGRAPVVGHLEQGAVAVRLIVGEGTHVSLRGLDVSSSGESV